MKPITRIFISLPLKNNLRIKRLITMIIKKLEIIPELELPLAFVHREYSEGKYSKFFARYILIQYTVSAFDGVNVIDKIKKILPNCEIIGGNEI